MILTDNTVLLGQLLRYTLVGGVAFIFDFSLLYILTERFSVYYLISAAVAFTVGLIINYIFSTLWVFEHRNIKDRYLEFFLFVLVGIIGLGLNELFLWLFTSFFQFYYMASKVISTLIVYGWNFFGRKYFLFR